LLLGSLKEFEPLEELSEPLYLTKIYSLFHPMKTGQNHIHGVCVGDKILPYASGDETGWLECLVDYGRLTEE